MDRAGLAEFLRRRREALQPEDVGMPRGPRRRTAGLRREEVALVSGMSTDYYTRLERQRGPRPSEQMVAAIARGLRLSLDERDHLFLLAGHGAPRRAVRTDHVSPGTMRILDRLQDTPAEVLTEIGETLVQTPPAVALLGDRTGFTGFARSHVYRWFTDPDSRLIHPEEDRDVHSRVFVSQLRAVATRDGRDSRAAAVAAELLDRSPEFATLWAAHEVGLRYPERKRFVHPEVGLVTVSCQVLEDPGQGQRLLVFTATPGTEDHAKLELLTVIGDQRLAS
jgi:transcriptional regulator with XRE-family HTH domain